jgi:hypothetical protein
LKQLTKKESRFFQKRLNNINSSGSALKPYPNGILQLSLLD